MEKLTEVQNLSDEPQRILGFNDTPPEIGTAPARSAKDPGPNDLDVFLGDDDDLAADLQRSFAKKLGDPGLKKNKKEFREMVKERLRDATKRGVQVDHVDDREVGSLEQMAGNVALDQVFKWILSRTAFFIQELNNATLAFNKAKKNNHPAETAIEQYRKTYERFLEFQNKLRGHPLELQYFPTAINDVTIVPITNHNYIVAARVKVVWKGRHSDGSTIHP